MAGTAGGFFWHYAEWNGIGAFIVALLIGALLVADGVHPGLGADRRVVGPGAGAGVCGGEPDVGI